MMESVKNVFFYILILIYSAFAADEESHSRSAYFTTREINDFKATLWSGLVSQFDIVQPVVFEKQLVYFHKLQDLFQEGRQGNLWT